MLTIREKFLVPGWEKKEFGKDSLFFDIETTGFSADTTQLYLIGCVYFREDSWWYCQWFAQKPEEEAEVIQAFFDFLNHYTCLIHFNGDGFDIPYIQKRVKRLGLSGDFSGVKSVDIYKCIRPYKALLGLSSCRQKAIEHFLHIDREDRFSGGELIQVYKEYVAARNPARKEQLLKPLLLHNAEDLMGMPKLLPVLNYPALLSGEFRFLSYKEEEYTNFRGEAARELLLTYESEYTIPQAFTINKNNWYLSVCGNQVRLRLPLLWDTLKYFYPDYKDYFYLPLEDMAIHKSVAAYVEKDFKKKATKETCYTKRKGVFFPQPIPVFTPSFKREYNEKLCYAEYTPDTMTQSPLLEQLLKTILTMTK